MGPNLDFSTEQIYILYYNNQRLNPCPFFPNDEWFANHYFFMNLPAEIWEGCILL